MTTIYTRFDLEGNCVIFTTSMRKCGSIDELPHPDDAYVLSSLEKKPGPYSVSFSRGFKNPIEVYGRDLDEALNRLVK